MSVKRCNLLRAAALGDEGKEFSKESKLAPKAHHRDLFVVISYGLAK